MVTGSPAGERRALQAVDEEFARGLAVGLRGHGHLHHAFLVLRPGDDAVAQVMDDPAARERHREAHVRVVETVVAHHALRAAGSEGHAVDGLHVDVAVVDITPGRIGNLRGCAGRLHGAGVGCRVGREHAVVDVGLAAFGTRAGDLEALLRLERGEHAAHGLRVVAGAHQVLHADAVGLHLGLAAVALHVGTRADVGHFGHGAGAGGDGRAHGQHLRQHAARLGARGVPRGHVRELVAQHGGQFGFGVQVGQQAAEDVDVAAAGGEGVDRIVVDDGELPGQVGLVAGARDALAHRVHVFLDGLVLVDAVELDDLVVGAPRGLDLALLGGEDDVLAAGGRVGGTAGREQRYGHETGEEATRDRQRTVHGRHLSTPTRFRQAP